MELSSSVIEIFLWLSGCDLRETDPSTFKITRYISLVEMLNLVHSYFVKVTVKDLIQKSTCKTFLPCFESYGCCAVCEFLG